MKKKGSNFLLALWRTDNLMVLKPKSGVLKDRSKPAHPRRLEHPGLARAKPLTFSIFHVFATESWLKQEKSTLSNEHCSERIGFTSR